MTEEWFILVFLLFHIIFCIVLAILKHLKVLQIPSRDLLLAVLLPLWGEVIVLLAIVYTKKNKSGDREHDLPKLEEIRGSLIHRPIFPEESLNNRVVPLEEALALEDPAVRRHLILEIVQKNPKHYIALLKKVRLGDDPEVSHYASTAIMQVQRAYETDLKRKEQRMKQQINNEEIVQDYLDTLNEYIQTGLLADNVLVAQRKKLNTINVNILSEHDGNKKLYRDAIDNLIELNDFTAAKSLLIDADTIWKNDEDFILLKLKISHKSKDRYAMRKEIQSVKESGIYLSPKTREVIEFWSGKI